MPLYEYECATCAHRFEKIQKFSDQPIQECPKCGGPVHKLMSSPAIQFKGSGWYITDYARKDTTPTGKEKSDTSGDKADKADTKTESKSETKTESKPAKADPAAPSKT
jgi:putative FmdB family regulatory protein